MITLQEEAIKENDPKLTATVPMLKGYFSEGLEGQNRVLLKSRYKDDIFDRKDEWSNLTVVYAFNFPSVRSKVMHPLSWRVKPGIIA